MSENVDCLIGVWLGGGQYSSVISILASGPSSPGFESQLWSFLSQKKLPMLLHELTAHCLYSGHWNAELRLLNTSSTSKWQACTAKSGLWPIIEWNFQEQFPQAAWFCRQIEWVNGKGWTWAHIKSTFLFRPSQHNFCHFLYWVQKNLHFYLICISQIKKFET